MTVAGAEYGRGHRQGRDALIGMGLVLTSGVGFGAVVVLARVAYDGGSTAPTSLLARFTLAGALMWAIVAARGQARRLPARRIGGFALMGLFFSAGSVASFKSVEYIPASLAALVFYIYPAIVTLGSALFFGTRYTLARLAVLTASLVGIALTIDVQSGPVSITGVALALASPVFYSGYVLVGSRATRGVPAMLASAWIISTAAVMMLLVGATGLIGDRFTADVSARGWAALLGLALFATVISITTFLAGMARIDVFRAAILSTFEPVVSVILAAVLLGERLTARQALGGAVIVGAALALQLLARSEGRATATSAGR